MSDGEDDDFAHLHGQGGEQSEETFRALVRMTLRQMSTTIRELKKTQDHMAATIDGLKEFRWRREGTAVLLVSMIPVTVQVVLFLMGKRP